MKRTPAHTGTLKSIFSAKAVPITEPNTSFKFKYYLNRTQVVSIFYSSMFHHLAWINLSFKIFYSSHTGRDEFPKKIHSIIILRYSHSLIIVIGKRPSWKEALTRYDRWLEVISLFHLTYLYCTSPFSSSRAYLILVTATLLLRSKLSLMLFHYHLYHLWSYIW